MSTLAAITAGAAVWALIGLPLPIPTIRLPAISPVAIAQAVGAAAATGLVALGLTRLPVVALAIASIAALGPVTTVAAKRRAEDDRIASAWPDLLALTRGRIAAGETIRDAVAGAVRRMEGRLGPIGGELETAMTSAGDTSIRMEELRNRLADPIADRVIVTLSTAHATGGPRVGSVLSALGASVADELRLRAAHRAALTQQRLTATAALLAPWALLVLTVLTNPQAADAFASNAGTRIVLGGLGATAAGYMLSTRAARLAAPPRVLA